MNLWCLRSSNLIAKFNIKQLKNDKKFVIVVTNIKNGHSDFLKRLFKQNSSYSKTSSGSTSIKIK